MAGIAFSTEPFCITHLVIAKFLQFLYSEDFTSTTCQDSVLTTAWWDTQTGQLKLHQFQFTEVGSYDTPGTAYCTAIAADFAYVADSYSGLQVIDISDPANPTLASSYITAIWVVGVDVEGDYALLIGDEEGLLILDISNPASPLLIGSKNTPGLTMDLPERVGVRHKSTYSNTLSLLRGQMIRAINDMRVF